MQSRSRIVFGDMLISPVIAGYGQELAIAMGMGESVSEG
jgi:hypothetical protein